MLSDLLPTLGIDWSESERIGTVRQAAFDGAHIGGFAEARSATFRWQQSSPDRAAWLICAYDFLENEASALEVPAQSSCQGGSLIWQLPNGLFAYGVMAANGIRLNELPVGVAGFTPPAVANGSGCAGCHQAGLFARPDELRARVEDSPGDYDPATRASIAVRYPRPDELRALADRDQAAHLAALRTLGIDPADQDPVSFAHADFLMRSLTAARAAGELGVDTATLLATPREQLDRRLQRLTTPGGLDRFTFTDAFLDSVCAVNETARNRPVACDVE